jgi:hypothetical protein
MRSIPLRATALALLPLLIIGSPGCGGTTGPKSYEVSGTVSYRGQPVPVGYVSLEPDPTAGNTGPGTMAKIVAGRYRTDRGRGVVGGPHRVRIFGFDGVPADDGLGDGTPLFAEVVYSVDLPKKASIQDFDVPGSTAKTARP